MAIITRASKGSELTHGEMDNNFTELESRINGKANTSHTHSISSITGLQDALDQKYEIGDVNVADGLVQLNPLGKIPCELLSDCFDVASKVSEDYLFDEGGKVRVSLLPTGSGAGECDCAAIEADILELQNNKASWARVVRRITAPSLTLGANEDIIIINDTISNFDISTNNVEGRIIVLRRIGTTTISLNMNFLKYDNTTTNQWLGSDGSVLTLVFHSGDWYKI